MHPQLRRAFDEAMTQARQRHARGDAVAAFAALERAHVLGQRHTRAHVLSHLWMLRVAWARADRREIVGQLLRVIAAALLSWLWVPPGNTGGANVGALRRMPVAPDVQVLLDADRAQPHFWSAPG